MIGDITSSVGEGQGWGCRVQGGGCRGAQGQHCQGNEEQGADILKFEVSSREVLQN